MLFRSLEGTPLFLQNRRAGHSLESIVLCHFPSTRTPSSIGYLPRCHCQPIPGTCCSLLLDVDDECIVVRVVKTSRIFFREPDNGAFSPCYLWYEARQLNILDYPKVSFTGYFGRPSGRSPSYDHPYVPYGWSWTFIIPSGVLLLRG